MIPFEYGPDRTLVIQASDPTPVLIDGYLLMLDERLDRLLVAFDAHAFVAPCWLPRKYVQWQILSQPAADFGLATFVLPAWLADNLDMMTSAALWQRRAEEIAAREAEKVREKKREQIRQLDRMGKAARAAKTKKTEIRNPQGNLFDE